MPDERLKELIVRKCSRFRTRVAENSKRYDGKEMQFTFHGGFNSGYATGQLSAWEEIADELGIDISDQNKG